MSKNILENGYGAVPKFVIADKNLSITAKAIYTLLCVFKGNDNIANPKKDTIKEYLGIGSKNTVYKHLKQLEDNGYIEITQGINVSGSGSNIFTSNNYLVFDEITVGKETVDVWSNGFSIVPRKVVQDKNISMCAKVVYTFLIGYKVDCSPSTKMIKDIIGLSNNKLTSTLNELETSAYILRENNSKGGKFTTNTYSAIGYDDLVDETLVEKLTNKILSKNKVKNTVEVKVSEDVEVVKDIKEVTTSQRKVINKRQRVISEKEQFNKNFSKAEKLLRKNLNMDILKDRLEQSPTNDLQEQYKFFETSINLMLEIMFSTEKTKRISGNIVPIELLQEMFFNLNYDTLNDVYHNVSLQNGFIKNMKSYMLSSIYNAITTPRLVVVS